MFAATVAALMLLGGCHRPAAVFEIPPVVGQQESASEPRLLEAGTADVAVIMYHDVVPRKEVWFDLTTREFEAQMRALADAGARVERLENVVSHLREGAPVPSRAVVLTFDDGTLGQYEHALPILRQYGFPATFFVHTDYVGVKTTKDHMTWDQLRELQAEGLVDIQPHTASHPEDLRALSDDAVRAEFSRSNAVFEREIGHAPRFLAYPSGHADERVARLVEEAGYEAAWNEERAWNASPADRFHLPRFAPFRLDEILDRLRADRVAGVRVWRSRRMGAPPAVEAREHGFSLGEWPSVAPRESHNLLGDAGFQPYPAARQRGAIGRPLLVWRSGDAVLADYQPWIGAERAAVEVLLPGAERAVIGRAWLLREGREQPYAGRVGGATVAGLLADGAPFWGRVPPNATKDDLRNVLLDINAAQAAIL